MWFNFICNFDCHIQQYNIKMKANIPKYAHTQYICIVNMWSKTIIGHSDTHNVPVSQNNFSQIIINIIIVNICQIHQSCVQYLT